MRALWSIYLFALSATVNCSLLEMSQTLWSKALEGGLTKIGVLDPLRIPVVKVDQSEGNTSYRMILRSVEIIGLNSSSLESIHIAKGRLKSNLSEHEAGYVSYTDQRQLDMIRYRFHTVVKEPKGQESQNLNVKAIPRLENSGRDENSNERMRNYDFASQDNGNRETFSRYRTNQERTMPQAQRMNYETSSTYENDRQRSRVHSSAYEMPNRRDEERGHYASTQNSQTNSRNHESTRNIPGRVQVVYAERQTHPGDNYRGTNQRFSTERSSVSGCSGSCEYRRNSYNTPMDDNRRRDRVENEEDKNIDGAASMNFESRTAYVDARLNPGRNSEQSTRGAFRSNGSRNDNRYAASFDAKIENANSDRRKYQQYSESASSGERLENQPGFVDIVYADDKDPKIKHFGNLRVEPGDDKTVYTLEDVLRDLRDHKRFIIHNFTEGEALTKKNDAVRTASETKRIKDLVRYAKDFQEKQGYYEQGMQLIYHYGGQEDDKIVKGNDGRRTKRAHLDEGSDDDVMHVIIRIRVPMLRVYAGYVLTGKVGKQVLRGNGLLSANFTELIGDFTLELKKVDDDTMIVQAARARLSASDKNITLQGMDEEGPVTEILTQGLIAAEAVAAMLADDLATKALSEKTADSIIYRMYKNLPSEN